MFQAWRFKLREAEEAFKTGRFEEAARLVEQAELRQYLPGQRLLTRVALGIAQRGRERVVNGDNRAGWTDFEAARKLVGDVQELLAVRQEMIVIALSEAEELLEADQHDRAMTCLEELERRHTAADQIEAVKETARRLKSALHLALHGKFAEADAQFVSAAALQPDWLWIAQKRQAWATKAQQARTLTERLHEAMAAENWTEAVSLADQLLEISPEYRVAKDARRRAWEKVGTRLAVTQPWQRRKSRPDTDRGNGHDTNANHGIGKRFFLWIDAVGGYFVCLSDEIVLGQASPGNAVDVPLLGDVSRRHAKIRRADEGYLLEPLGGSVRVGGQDVAAVTTLRDGDEIELGRAVKLRFRKPHALSASARLEFVSRHRTQPSADGILLMAESCVLGPKWQNHIVCRDWAHDVVLYRQNDQLFCRAMQSIQIDGQLCDGRGPLGPNSHVVGDDFSLSLEELDR